MNVRWTREWWRIAFSHFSEYEKQACVYCLETILCSSLSPSVLHRAKGKSARFRVSLRILRSKDRTFRSGWPSSLDRRRGRRVASVATLWQSEGLREPIWMPIKASLFDIYCLVLSLSLSLSRSLQLVSRDIAGRRVTFLFTSLEAFSRNR